MSFNVRRWEGQFVGGGMIQLHVNHMVRTRWCKYGGRNDTGLK